MKMLCGHCHNYVLVFQNCLIDKSAAWFIIQRHFYLMNDMKLGLLHGD